MRRVYGTLAQRLEANSLPVPWTGCRLWEGSTNGRYGVLRTKDRRFVYAHRLAYELVHGSVPAGMMVLHKCDEPLCVEPGHLYCGTQADNLNDMARKGRGRRSSTGLPYGVCISKGRRKKYQAQVTIGHASVKLGRYLTAEEASRAAAEYKAAVRGL